MPDEILPPNDSSEEDKYSDKDIPEELKPLWKGLPDPQRKAVLTILRGVSIQIRAFRGPLPPPDILKGYNDVLPGGAERIFSSFEKQSHHRMDLERFVVTEQQKQSARGQLFGFIIAILFLFVAGFLIYTGHEWAGGILGTIDIVALVTVFVIGKNQQKRDLKEKE